MRQLTTSRRRRARRTRRSNGDKPMPETIEQIRKRSRAAGAGLQSAADVRRLRERMHRAKDRMLPFARAANWCRAAMQRVAERHPDVSAADLRTAMTAITFFVPFA